MSLSCNVFCIWATTLWTSICYLTTGARISFTCYLIWMSLSWNCCCFGIMAAVLTCTASLLLSVGCASRCLCYSPRAKCVLMSWGYFKCFGNGACIVTHKGYFYSSCSCIYVIRVGYFIILAFSQTCIIVTLKHIDLWLYLWTGTFILSHWTVGEVYSCALACESKRIDRIVNDLCSDIITHTGYNDGSCSCIYIVRILNRIIRIIHIWACSPKFFSFIVYSNILWLFLITAIYKSVFRKRYLKIICIWWCNVCKLILYAVFFTILSAGTVGCAVDHFDIVETVCFKCSYCIWNSYL